MVPGHAVVAQNVAIYRKDLPILAIGAAKSQSIVDCDRQGRLVILSALVEQRKFQCALVLGKLTV